MPGPSTSALPAASTSRSSADTCVRQNGSVAPALPVPRFPGMQHAHWPVPAEFARRTAEVYGAAGAVWLDGLPALLRECAERWSLAVSQPFEPLSYNYVAPAFGADGRALVLKLGVPNPELSSEIAALRR